jgi:hypothetical protein
MSPYDTVVTVRTEQTPYLTSDVIVIYGQSCLELFGVSRTDGTTLILVRQHLVVLLYRDTVQSLEVAGSTLVLVCH